MKRTEFSGHSSKPVECDGIQGDGVNRVEIETVSALCQWREAARLDATIEVNLKGLGYVG